MLPSLLQQAPPGSPPRLPETPKALAHSTLILSLLIFVDLCLGHSSPTLVGVYDEEEVICPRSALTGEISF